MEHVPPMQQVAPFPVALADLVRRMTCKPEWHITLEHLDRDQGSEGLTLVILVYGPDSYNPKQRFGVRHFFIVPAASYDERAWMRWLFDQCVLVETHELMEWFKIDDSRPYAPNHGPGRNPYSILERGTEEDANSDQRGNKAARTA